MSRNIDVGGSTFTVLSATETPPPRSARAFAPASKRPVRLAIEALAVGESIVMPHNHPAFGRIKDPRAAVLSATYAVTKAAGWRVRCYLADSRDASVVIRDA